MIDNIHGGYYNLFCKEAGNQRRAGLPGSEAERVQQRCNQPAEFSQKAVIHVHIESGGSGIGHQPDNNGTGKDNGARFAQEALAFLPGAAAKRLKLGHTVWRQLDNKDGRFILEQVFGEQLAQKQGEYNTKHIH
ncbi:hypothetical protein D3C80_1579560 [compost metagenome]